MKLVVLTLAALCACGVNGVDWNALHVKFDILKGYYSIPTTKAKFQVSDYYYMASDDDLSLDFYSLKWDPRVSFGLDKNGNIAAVRTGYIKADVGNKATANNLTFPTSLFDNSPMYGNATYWDIDVWYNTVLFASPDVLRTTGRQYTDQIADDIYIKLNGNWTVIPRKEEDAEGQGFTKQGCFVGMGRHYFYNMTTDANCEDLPGVFLTYESKLLVGVGLIPFGDFTSLGSTTWFETVPALSMKVITPDAPQCAKDWLNNYGVSSLHIFFKRFPRLTLCNWPFNNKAE